ncbi:hypothetical protein BV25DRAFT_1841359 [Artomyces pyxidatus]|uniref:Uncharacterized protein n=1 Tax=Artomyces pyxidatus TaxID=48021 RepID=A0ACB8SQ83_9AGAM|nr:hypothetical protein BV25DRAFT_1841359 [Artomyces pyxidatus]
MRTDTRRFDSRLVFKHRFGGAPGLRFHCAQAAHPTLHSLTTTSGPVKLANLNEQDQNPRCRVDIPTVTRAVHRPKLKTLGDWFRSAWTASFGALFRESDVRRAPSSFSLVVDIWPDPGAAPQDAGEYQAGLDLVPKVCLRIYDLPPASAHPGSRAGPWGRAKGATRDSRDRRGTIAPSSGGGGDGATEGNIPLVDAVKVKLDEMLQEPKEISGTLRDQAKADLGEKEKDKDGIEVEELSARGDTSRRKRAEEDGKTERSPGGIRPADAVQTKIKLSTMNKGATLALREASSGVVVPKEPESASEGQLITLQRAHSVRVTLADLSSVTGKYRAVREISDLAVQIQEAKLSDLLPPPTGSPVDSMLLSHSQFPQA